MSEPCTRDTSPGILVIISVMMTNMSEPCTPDTSPDIVVIISVMITNMSEPCTPDTSPDILAVITVTMTNTLRSLICQNHVPGWPWAVGPWAAAVYRDRRPSLAARGSPPDILVIMSVMITNMSGGPRESALVYSIRSVGPARTHALSSPMNPGGYMLSVGRRFSGLAASRDTDARACHACPCERLDGREPRDEELEG